MYATKIANVNDNYCFKDLDDFELKLS